MDDSFSHWWQIFLYIMQIFWIPLWKLSLSTHTACCYVICSLCSGIKLLVSNRYLIAISYETIVLIKAQIKRGIHSLREQTCNKNRAQNEMKRLEQTGRKVIWTSHYHCDSGRDSGENVSKWCRMSCDLFQGRSCLTWRGSPPLKFTTGSPTVAKRSRDGLTLVMWLWGGTTDVHSDLWLLCTFNYIPFC